MSLGKVIQTLRASTPLASLTEAELKVLANCGRIYEYAPGQTILQANNTDAYLFVLRLGRATLHVSMSSHGGQCQGEATVEINSTGQVFGWSTWLQPDGITVAAYALEPCSLVKLNLGRLKDAQMFWKVSWRMLQELYGLLQEYGLCPPNMQALLKLGQIATFDMHASKWRSIRR